ncbi:hypothetical protein EDB87DRAFT_276284 [Lactarius vividus]|nr:hypothetical protein EDB87DRAFT_276284 [Lactarius vividus]
MPALIPVDNTLGALFIGTVLSSVIYGVTWLQVYSYYNNHCSRDRWPLKSFVAFLMLLDTANLVFSTYTTYHIGITNFGDYRSNTFKTWSRPATALSAIVLEVLVQHFYVYRIYHLSGGSPFLPAAISVVALTEFGIGVAYTAEASAIVAHVLSLVLTSSTRSLKHIHDPGSHFQELFIAALSCKVLCDVLITVGMVYTLLSNRTRVRRTNNVLNLLAIYSINCGTLHLAFAISCVTLLAKYRDALIYTPSLFITIRLSLCAFMSILNSRDNLRETLNGPEGVVTFTQLNVHTGTTVQWGAQNTAEVNAGMAVSKSPPPASVSSDTSFSDSVITFDRTTEKVPRTPVAEVVAV